MTLPLLAASLAFTGATVAFFVTATANMLSIIGCAYLLGRLRTLPVGTRSRLFPRQIRLLAISDIIFHLASTLTVFIGYGGTGVSLRRLFGHRNFCHFSAPFLYSGTNAAWLCALHISVGFALQALRWQSALDIWSAALSLVWPIAALLAVAEIVIYKPMPNDSGWCVITDYSRDNIFVIGECLTFACAVASNVVIFFAALRNRKMSRPLMRAAAYPINFIITQMVVLYLVFTPTEHMGITHPLTIAAVTLQNLNGFVNTITYIWQSHFVARALRQRLLRTGAADTVPTTWTTYAGPQLSQTNSSQRSDPATAIEVTRPAWMDSNDSMSLNSQSRPCSERDYQ